MKISELIQQLQDSLEVNGDLEVMSSSNYGDYHSTEQLDVIASIETCFPIKSAYSGTGLAYPNGDEEEDEEESGKEMVLVLRYTY